MESGGREEEKGGRKEEGRRKKGAEHFSTVILLVGFSLSFTYLLVEVRGRGSLFPGEGSGRRWESTTTGSSVYFVLVVCSVFFLRPLLNDKVFFGTIPRVFLPSCHCRKESGGKL